MSFFPLILARLQSLLNVQIPCEKQPLLGDHYFLCNLCKILMLFQLPEINLKRVSSSKIWSNE